MSPDFTDAVLAALRAVPHDPMCASMDDITPGICSCDREAVQAARVARAIEAAQASAEAVAKDYDPDMLGAALAVPAGPTEEPPGRV